MFFELTLFPRTSGEEEKRWLFDVCDIEDIIPGCGRCRPEHPLTVELPDGSKLCADVVEVIPKPRDGVKYQ